MLGLATRLTKMEASQTGSRSMVLMENSKPESFHNGVSTWIVEVLQQNKLMGLQHHSCSQLRNGNDWGGSLPRESLLYPRNIHNQTKKTGHIQGLEFQPNSVWKQQGEFYHQDIFRNPFTISIATSLLVYFSLFTKVLASNFFELWDAVFSLVVLCNMCAPAFLSW